MSQPRFEGLMSSKVSECLHPWQKEVCTSHYRREGRQPRYLLADRPFRHGKIEAAILVADQRVSFVPQLVKIRVIDPDILRELELAHEASTQNESCNAAINAVLRHTFGQ